MRGIIAVVLAALAVLYSLIVLLSTILRRGSRTFMQPAYCSRCTMR